MNELEFLAAHLVKLYGARDDLDAEIDAVKEKMTSLAGGQSAEVKVDGVRVIVGVRTGRRRINVMALRRQGVAIEEFSTITPSLTKFEAFRSRMGWSEEFAGQFIIESTETHPFVAVRKPSTNEENDSD